jgi:CRP/FNR family transcriptional regulator, cyclic AMP receptor protein
MILSRFSNDLRVRSLKNVHIFSECTRGELRRIASLTSECRAQAGSALTVAETPGSEFFAIVDGTATVWRNDVRLDTLGPGSYFGELALLNRGMRTATVIADTDMELLVSSLREFRSPYFLVPSVMELMLAVMSERIRRADEGWTRHAARIERLLTTDRSQVADR